MTNRPCLDKEKAVDIIFEQLKQFGIDRELIEELLQPAFIGWFSRSLATAIFVYCKDKEGDWYILASERGEDAADFKGFWNCTCGYLDFNETFEQCALRELYEETGITIDDDIIEQVGIEDNPEANRQNVTVRFAAFIQDKTIDDFTFSKENNEGREVGDIKWIKLSDINQYKWAFGHDKYIKKISEAHQLLTEKLEKDNQ